MIIYKKLSFSNTNTYDKGKDRFYRFLKIFLALNSFPMDPDPYRFCLDLDPDQYENSVRIRNRKYTYQMIRIRNTAEWIQKSRQSYRLAVIVFVGLPLPAENGGQLLGTGFPVLQGSAHPSGGHPLQESRLLARDTGLKKARERERELVI